MDRGAAMDSGETEMAVVGLLGRKIGMTQVFDEDGTVRGVTVLEMGPCQVLQVRTEEKDGYAAIQLGFDDKPRRRATKAERGHVAKVSAEPKRFVREIRLDAAAEQEAGAVLTVDVFNDIKKVDVTGTMKGRGFAGVMKRHGFPGLEATHGVQRKNRAAGSIGCSAFPSRVVKGRRMNGQYGNCKNTVRHLKVVRIDIENNCLLVEGGVPGPNGGYVLVRKSR
jgi:large subunit ribosomal protein L3